MKRKASSSDSKPISKDESSSSSKRSTKMVVKPLNTSSHPVSPDYYTSIQKYSLIPALDCVIADCQEVQRNGSIIIYRAPARWDGSTEFHAVDGETKRLISRNITFEFLHPVNSFIYFLFIFLTIYVCCRSLS
jgi:hypothetical protein